MSLYMFIASDYPIPLVNNSKVKHYKFKKGVKVSLDDDGKWYYYTNESDKNSPDLLIPCNVEDKPDTIVVDSEEDLREIQISIGYKSDDVEWCTQKNNIYSLGWGYTDKRASELINYLSENINIGYEIELWSTWMGEHQKPIKYYRDIERLTIQDIKKVFDRKGFDKPECIVISKKV